MFMFWSCCGMSCDPHWPCDPHLFVTGDSEIPREKFCLKVYNFCFIQASHSSHILSSFVFASALGVIKRCLQYSVWDLIPSSQLWRTVGQVLFKYQQAKTHWGQWKQALICCAGKVCILTSSFHPYTGTVGQPFHSEIVNACPWHSLLNIWKG